MSGFYQEGNGSRFLVKNVKLIFKHKRFFLFCIVLLLDSYTFNFFKFLKYIYKNLHHSRGAVPPVHRDRGHIISLFLLLYCSMFFKCKYVFFSFVPHCVQCFFLLPSICFHPSWTQKCFCLQTDIRNCFEGSDALLSLVIRSFLLKLSCFLSPYT